jgi:hypothetical protein
LFVLTGRYVWEPFAMAIFSPFAIEPMVIVTGSPEQADRFLTTALWSAGSTSVSTHLA